MNNVGDINAQIRKDEKSNSACTASQKESRFSPENKLECPDTKFQKEKGELWTYI